MLLPLIPVITLVSRADSGGGGGGGSTTINITNITNGDNATQNVSGNDSVNISGIENAYIDAPGANIYVEGDYYEQGFQFNPKVTEIWSANNKVGALFNPTVDDLDKHIIPTIMQAEGFAMIYPGWMNLVNNGPYKPKGVTRYGEVLGYDVYAPDGEEFSCNDGVWGFTETRYLDDGDKVNINWTLINVYRAVGVEIQDVYYYVYKMTNEDGSYNTKIDDLTGKKGWDLNESPLSTELTGALQESFEVEYPVVGVAVSRTKAQSYLDRAARDMVNFAPRDKTAISYIEFFTIVADLMEMYGEPVITDQEKYMLLEAYGRDLPYGLYPTQLEAVEYLLCRGILESSQYDWHQPIPFEEAADVLMRVKDEGSRFTFKEFQLTTDLELLSKGYYPVEVALIPEPLPMAEPVYDSPAAATHYDFYVRREDNRVLFEASQPDGSGGVAAAVPHISTGLDDWNTILYGTYFHGVDEYGYYHFSVPVSYFANGFNGTLYINSRNSESDDPAQYPVEVTSETAGGIYVLDASGGVVSHESFDEFGGVYSSKNNVDAPRRTAAIEGDVEVQTAVGTEAVKTWLLDIPVKFAKLVELEVGGTTKKLNLYATNTQYEVGDIKFTMDDISDEYYRATVTRDTGLTRDEALKALNCDTVPSGYNDMLKDGEVAVNTTQGYCQRNSRYLLGVSYLEELGYVHKFIPYGDGLFYLSVNPDLVATSKEHRNVIVNTKANTVTFGAVVYKMPASVSLVFMKNGEYFIDTQVVNGRVSQTVADVFSELELVSMSSDIGGQWGTVSMASYQVEEFLTQGYSESVTVDDYRFAAQVFTFDGVDGEWVDATQVFMGETNLVVSVDLASGGAATAFALWELGSEIPESMREKNEYNKRQFNNMLGSVLESDTVLYQMLVAPPEAGVGLGIMTTNEGNVLLKLDETGYASDADVGEMYANLSPEEFTLPFFKEASSGSYYNILRDFYNGEPIRLCVRYDWESAQWLSAYIEADKLVQSGTTYSLYGLSDASVVKYAPVGVSSILGGFVTSFDGSANLFRQVGGTSGTILMYAGASIIASGPSANVPAFAGEAYVLNLYNTIGQGKLIVQTNGITFKDMDVAASGGSGASTKWQVGDTNAITDWLSWLKEAKLSDAEDIVTICIIAVLNLLPRFFMFLFIILMALAMISNIKPWIIFCDKVFDPYKFLTAGRMTVHTVDLKMVVLYSLIALCLFGLFQNGLILDVIAWCTRAVTGILNR